MNIKKITKKVVSKKRSSLKSVAMVEKQAAWDLSSRDIKNRIKRINEDFSRAFKLLQNHTDTVTFFGSARFDENNPHYKDARKLARRISSELQLTVVTGGGPGIMEAANRGANEACTVSEHTNLNEDEVHVCGESLAMTIDLPTEQVSNPYAKHSADFYYFFSRKVALAYAARAYVCYPGGFGTLDEFFEVLTLKQTHKIPNIPIILCGSSYWQPLLEYIDDTVLNYAKAISEEDRKLYILTDNHDEILRIIADSNVHKLS